MSITERRATFDFHTSMEMRVFFEALKAEGLIGEYKMTGRPVGSRLDLPIGDNFPQVAAVAVLHMPVQITLE